MNSLSSELFPPCISPEHAGTIIRRTTIPVTGCTEPASIGLATSLAADGVLGRLPQWLAGKKDAGSALVEQGDKNVSDTPLDVEHVSIRTTRNLYKNALAVGIPNSGGGSGIHLAAALGPYLDSGSGLNLLKDCSAKALASARRLMDEGRLSLEVYGDASESFFVEARLIGVVDGQRHVGEAIIAGSHADVSVVRRNGIVLYHRTGDDVSSEDGLHMDRLAACEISGLLATAANLSADVRNHIWKGVEMNREAARVGLEKGLGMGVGAAIRSLIEEGVLKDDLQTRAGMYTAAATDARMSGHEIAVMSSSGSGNQGIMTILPLLVVGEYMKVPKEKIVHGIAVSHLITAVMTYHTGLLSPLCGCVIKAGMGAAAGIAVVLGLDDIGVLASLQNMAGNMTGEICDGAKVGCAVKLGAAARAAVLSALLASKGVSIPADNGILASTGKDLFRNIGDLARSMENVDRTIVGIMERKENYPRM